MNKSNVWADLEKENANVYKDNVNSTYLTFDIFYIGWGATFETIRYASSFPSGDGNDSWPWHLLSQIL